MLCLHITAEENDILCKSLPFLREPIDNSTKSYYNAWYDFVLTGAYMDTYLSEEMKHINYLTTEIDEAYHEAALKLGLSDSTMLVLYTVCNHGESCLVNDIIRLSGISKQTLNSALRKLENEDVIYLEAVGGKKKQVCLTDKGKTLVKGTVLRVIEIENAIFDSWTERERTLYVELTRKYLLDFKEKVKELSQ